MSTLSARRKAMRGTKRTCQACDVRFYDLARSPILCPSCGAHFTPAPEPVARASARLAPFASKTGWRSQPFKRPQPMLPVGDLKPSDPSDTATVEDETEETASVDSEDGVVLDQEQDDASASGLVDHDAVDAEER